MKTFTFRMHRAFVLVLIGGVLAGAYLWSAFHNSDVRADAEFAGVTKSNDYYSADTVQSFGFPVAGVIEAQDAITVRAQTSGVITTVIAQEGQTVQAGHTLVMQQVPLVESRLALREAENQLNTLSVSAAETIKNGQFKAARIQEDVASTSVALTDVGVRTQTENNTALLVTQLYGSVTTLIATLDFIDENKTYFSGRSLTEFREIVGSLYGNSRSYLTGSVHYKLNSHDDILAVLDTATVDTPYPEPAVLLELAKLVDTELDAVRTVLTDGEADFLDAKVIDQADPLYAEYLAKRSEVVAVQTTLRTRVGALRSAQTTGSLESLSADGGAALRSVEYGTAAEVLKNAELTVEQSSRVADAALGVLYSEAALGMAQAPFAGTIENVYVSAGEYVALGAPLMTLVGEGARELKVTVPPAMLPYLRQGAPFIVNAQAVGYVARFAPLVSAGTVTVFIELTEGELTVGEVFRGDIQFTFDSGEVVAIPRSFVQFDNLGAYVQTETNSRISVAIVYDTGKTFVVRSEKPITEKLTKAVGIAL